MFFISKRPAIAMIELIFAIVVMGIVMMSAPMLVSTASKTTTVALQQEGINEAASRINMILTYPWDENDTNASCIPPVLNVANGDPALDENSTTKRRIGVPLGTNSRTFECQGQDDWSASTALAKEGVAEDDMDDFSGNSLLNNVAGGAGGVDYIEQNTVTMATAIAYVEDNATTGSYASTTFTYVPTTTSATSTNIKRIRVVLTSTSGASELNQKQITLNAFSCNIGGYEYESRVMP